MPPKRSDYQPLGQDEDEDDLGVGPSSPAAAAVGAGRRGRRTSRPGRIDLTRVDEAFTAWKAAIAARLTRKSFKQSSVRREIVHTVFGPAVPFPGNEIITVGFPPAVTPEEYAKNVTAIREAIEEGLHPKLIAKGSSGSYFARAKIDERVQTVGVFKPKDEEPYGNANPKLIKWLHRNTLWWLIPFGRACLIPNLSYVSEAAASLLDERLGLQIVPRTELISLSTPAFYYPWHIRRSAKKGNPLPVKIGSLQHFMTGFQDASAFLRDHPLPGRSIADTFDDSTHRTGNVNAKRFWAALSVLCGRTGAEQTLYEEDPEDESDMIFDTNVDPANRPFHWSPSLLQSLREELEKLVILDVIMLNTDRGMDNFMLKFIEGEQDKREPVNIGPSRSQMPLMSELKASSGDFTASFGSPSGTRSATPTAPATKAQIRLAAIDNSLSFPHEHPKKQGWRSFTYGWLYLPVSIIGKPFSQKTRQAILPLLTSKEWWEETTFQLRKIFALDPDFHPKMFARQLAVIKGQAWNVVQSLKHPDEGPLELTRRQKILVWDDEIELSDDLDPTTPVISRPVMNMSQSIGELPPRSPTRPNHRRSLSAGGRAPQVRRSSVTGAPLRPVPFASKHEQINPGASAVSVLEHLDRLDKVEAGLQRLRVGDSVPEEDEEEDTTPRAGGSSPQVQAEREEHSVDVGVVNTETPAAPEREEGVQRAVFGAPTSLSERIASPESPRHWAEGIMSGRSSLEEAEKRVVIMERLETVDSKNFMTCC
ncbi:phosphatidylinositol 3 and 4-kinase-domain-containing protein [Auriculariales sp. MPI-PUGE-AT-0066]|nr:phosphatidylinositol 3 and 4-kinase-domain-containing protein [Auriculariales sp. MPI-PUGE-AT-0066]